MFSQSRLNLNQFSVNPAGHFDPKAIPFQNMSVFRIVAAHFVQGWVQCAHVGATPVGVAGGRRLLRRLHSMRLGCLARTSVHIHLVCIHYLQQNFWKICDFTLHPECRLHQLKVISTCGRQVALLSASLALSARIVCEFAHLDARERLGLKPGLQTGTPNLGICFCWNLVGTPHDLLIGGRPVKTPLCRYSCA